VNETLNNTEITLTLGNDYGTGTYKYFILGEITHSKYLKNISKFNFITVTNEDTHSTTTTDDRSESSFPHWIWALVVPGLLAVVAVLFDIFVLKSRYLNQLKSAICGSDSNDGVVNDITICLPPIETNASNNLASTTNEPTSA
jgi:hypothetical protein